MRILHVHCDPYYPLGLGGSEVANRGVLEMLVRAGFEVEAVCRKYNGHPGAPRTPEQLATWEAEWVAAVRGLGGTVDPSRDRFTLGGVDVHLAADDDALLELFARRVDQRAPDRVLISGYERDPPRLLERVVEACGRRAFHLAHSVMSLPFGPHAWLPSEPERELLARLGGIVACSRYVADYIRRWGQLEATPLYFPAYSTEPLHSLGSPSGHVTFVNPCAMKGLAVFAELARALPAVKLVAVPHWGTGPDDLDILGKLPNVTLGAPSHSPNEFLRGSSVVVMPSLCYEGLGLVPIEAMARGIPVLLSDLGALREASLGVARLLPVNPLAVSRGADGRPIFTAPPQRIEAWALALTQLLADPAAYRAASRAAEERARAFIAAIEIETRAGLCHLLRESE